VFEKTTTDLSSSCWVIIDSGLSDILKTHLCEFADSASKEYGLELVVTAGEPQAKKAFLRVRKRGRTENSQEYSIVCNNNGIILESSGEAGIFYGLQTLKQILEQTCGRPPVFHIKDRPDFNARGLMLDISRCKVPTMDTLRACVRMMASLKLNQLQLYTEHTFAFSAHETVWRGFSPVTSAEILELDAYCRTHFVELVPNLNSFGHFARWLCHPQYRYLAECPDGYTSTSGLHLPWSGTLSPNAKSLTFLNGLYNEMLPNFTSRMFNVGCDETTELGKGKSTAKCKKNGTTAVYLDFLLKIDKLSHRYGRNIQFWGDIILHEPSLISKLPRDITALDWGYESDHPFESQTMQFAKSGVPFYVCPGTSAWSSLTGRTANCIGNLSNAAKNGLKNKAAGYLITDWGDGGHHQYFPLSYMGIYCGAGYSWNYSGNINQDIGVVLSRMAFCDSTEILGNSFFQLGKVLELCGAATRNASIFNQMLFAQKEYLEKLTAEIDVRNLKKCLERLNELETETKKSKPAVNDGKLIIDEFINNLSMARLSVKKALALKEEKTWHALLKNELKEIVSEHQRLWLARNRVGGMHESIERLNGVLG
jgi:hypothetical protein